MFPAIGARVFAVSLLLCLHPSCADRPPSASGHSVVPPRSSRLAPPQASGADVASAIQSLVDGRDPPLSVLTPAERAELRALYRPGDHAPLWLDTTRQPGRNARDALALLDHAADEGLDPLDYGGSRLEGLAAMLDGPSPARPQDLASFDVALSAGMLRYLRHLHVGRVDPLTWGLRLKGPDDRHDWPVLLRSALAGQRITQTAEDLAPALAQYRALRATLARYRALLADASLKGLPPSFSGVRPAETCASLDTLYRLLVALGDLPTATPAPDPLALYDGALVEGVKRFQIRHGLDEDGVVGKRTLAALNVPLARRVRQIELALERLRWLPHVADARLVVVNIPMFRLWAWDADNVNGAPTLAMNVIVGRAVRTETPVFVEHLREVIFRPYWNIPPSILRHELLPIIERDPEYLKRQDMEIVRGPGDDAQPVEATVENIAALRQGALRLRQRPGPRNSLGLIKFVFPNEENVYMHGTPAQQLFARSRRDFSHGCVRVQDPVALAQWAFEEKPDWNRDRIVAAMAGSPSLHVTLLQPIRVILFYTTAMVTPDEGTIRFAEDIYGHDARLDRALVADRSGE